jgi:hypothetical protein
MHKLPENWKDWSIAEKDFFKGKTYRLYQQTQRAKNTPSSDIVTFYLKERDKYLVWTEATLLRVLDLSRKPALSAATIAEILSKEFNLYFTHNTVLGVLSRLRILDKKRR